MFGMFKQCERQGWCPSLPEPNPRYLKLPELDTIAVFSKQVESGHQTDDRYRLIGFGSVFAVGIWSDGYSENGEGWKIEGTYAIEANAEAHAEQLRNAKAGA